LSGFIPLYALKYTTKLDTLDWTVFWSNVLAESLQPALFLHFALCFPEERLKKSAATGYCLWFTAPGAGCSGCGYGPSKPGCQTGLLLHRLNRSPPPTTPGFTYWRAALPAQLQRADSPLLRQQLKWVTRGTLLAVLPFSLFYAIPFLFDLHPPGLLTKLAGLSLVFLPLTFSWAIVRYRLMDTDRSSSGASPTAGHPA